MHELNHFDRLQELCGMVRDGDLTVEMIDELEVLLAADDEYRRYYADFMFMHALMERYSQAFRDGSTLCESLAQRHSCDEDEYHDKSLPSPVIGLFGNPLENPVNIFPSVVPLSYLVATILFCFAFLIGSFVRIDTPRPGKVAENLLPPVSSPPADNRQLVGHITGLTDCRGQRWSVDNGRWSEIPNQNSTIINRQFFLGDRYVLSSGLLEIAYDSGAKVILQGPCTYRIDAVDGGFLAVGKLTALVKKKGAEEEEKDNTTIYPNPKSPLPLFAVRTPTAVVTDLGTEFGVEVEKSGMTRSHVFQGSVELRASSSLGAHITKSPVEVLHAGESARMEWGRNRAVVILRELGQSGRFVRQIPNSKSQISTSPPSSFTYHLTDLGTLGGQESHAYAINVAGQVVGDAATTAGERHAFLFDDGKLKDLGTLGAGDSCANDINAHGHVVGGSGGKSNNCVAFLYRDGIMTSLGTLGGHNSRALAVNDVGQIVGASLNAKGVDRAFLYTTGRTMKDLGALGGSGASSWALDVNATGQVVGYSTTEGDLVQAFLYSSDCGMKSLGTLGGPCSRAYRINAAGMITGISVVADGAAHAFLFSSATGMQDIGAFGGSDNIAFDINNAGQVVGCVKKIASDTGIVSPKAFLYSNGQVIDLHALVDRSDGWIFHAATAINDSGQIAGYGKSPDGNTRAFLLTPITNH